MAKLFLGSLLMAFGTITMIAGIGVMATPASFPEHAVYEVFEAVGAVACAVLMAISFVDWLLNRG